MSGLLAGTCYDPGTAVAKDTSAALAMTALDTTNLRLTFTAPSNGIVWCRMMGTVTGATTAPQLLLGAMNGATVVGRIAPIGARAATAVSTSRLNQLAGFPITGLTPGNSYSLDAAYGVETGVASTNLKYGGPNNTTTNDAWGGFCYEIWDTPNLLGAILYDPASSASKATTSLLAMTALDTTNLRITFTAPTSGNVLVSLQGMTEGATTAPAVLLGVLDGATVRARTQPLGGQMDYSQAAATHQVLRAEALVTGLTPGNSYTWDAAYGVEIVVASTGLKYGGADNSSADDAYGGFSFCVWAV